MRNCKPGRRVDTHCFSTVRRCSGKFCAGKLAPTSAPVLLGAAKVAATLPHRKVGTGPLNGSLHRSGTVIGSCETVERFVPRRPASCEASIASRSVDSSVPPGHAISNERSGFRSPPEPVEIPLPTFEELMVSGLALFVPSERAQPMSRQFGPRHLGTESEGRANNHRLQPTSAGGIMIRGG
jgi:hypothetical protein